MKIEIKRRMARKDPMEAALGQLIDEADDIEGESVMHRMAALDPAKKPPEAPGHTDIVIDIAKAKGDESAPGHELAENDHAEPDEDQRGGPSDYDEDNEDDGDEEFWRTFGKSKPRKV